MLIKIATQIYVMFNKLIRAYCAIFAQISFKCRGVRFGAHLSVRGKIKLHISPNSKVVIGNNVKIKSGFAENPVGGNFKTYIWTNRGANLIIKDNVGISNATIVCSDSITIGDNTCIGGGTCIYDTDFHSLDPAVRISGEDNQVKTSPVKIGNECFIGGHCIILKGVTIGDQSIIGAGSVVTKNIPPKQIWAGNPARFIREL